MKTQQPKPSQAWMFNVLLPLLLLTCAGSPFAAVRYVDATSASPTPPYTNWATAARIIQDVVDAADSGDEIVVTSGTYATGGRAVGTNLLVNRVVVDKPLTVRSVNGPEFTVIQGYQVPGTTNGDGAIRCVYLADGANLSGFTLTNGATRSTGEWRELGGGGVWCDSTNAVVSNCTLTGNSTCGCGGGAYGGTLNNCTLRSNSAECGGGGFASTLNNCVLTGNSALYRGGGATGGTLNNCTLTGNSATWGGGLASEWFFPCAANNCVLTHNSADEDGGAHYAALNNCIVYFNNATNRANYSEYPSEYTTLNYCCTTPLPTNGVGNITNAPLFVDVAGGNLRLRSNSPCINAGRNAWGCFTAEGDFRLVAPGPTDLDGKPRIVGGTVDIGAYEFQGPVPGSWTKKTNMPAPASTCASCVLDGILYVMGGHDDKPSTHALANVWTYDPRTDSWTNKAPLPIARHFLGQCAVAVDGMIYLVGGTGPGMPGALMLPVAVYNPRTDTWTNGANMPTGRGNLAACAVDGIIYAIGGATSTSTQTAAVEAYDPRSNQWTTRRSMPQARWFVTASVVNGLIYVFHGTDVFLYNPKTDSWTTQASHFSPYSWGLMSAEVDGIIYLFGGFTQDWRDGHDFVLAYDPIQDQFTARRKMPRKRATAACGVIEGKIYLAGGASMEPLVNPDAVFYRELDVFDPQGGVTPQILGLTCGSTNRVRLVWQGEAGVRYGVESRPNADTGSWTRLTFSTGTNSVLATNGIVGATCTVPSPDTNRFFRILETD